ncbi:hypothetical protein [Tritonibacter mobilis]|uniref:Uncharacterized protein n=1 Tax=Tritonibacter mobilis F1926 TaxID=1265309 RepID=A0A1B1A2Z4_9RHOB|nr:hypothetical protein [Tritonibacter mobilis]MCZ4267991.1 hypothetical protein [Rhodobacteraceae bacterium G21628-S1]NKX28523.1 hypothetical protein [Rhodobacteraceae bacterium R_SAG6]PXW82739.1 hypothetical protein BZA02_10257 [Ruegeria sp. P4]ANP40955.1 hypothetical protein K529_009300 [Tritonibacter mobilis F1926]KJZ24275.1 hypothetical protein TW79_10600 [Tritonibacter mobilis]
MKGTAHQPSFDAFLLLVGRLNYAWTNTESLLIHLIAGLAEVDKETATVIFLTLNTTRARIDLVERLSKLDRVSADERDPVLALTGRIQRQSALRNRYNHCIYAFDPENGNLHTILMRIADRKDTLKIGQSTPLNDAAAEDIETAISELTAINHGIWQVIAQFGYPA